MKALIIESVVVSLVTLAAACALQLDEQEGNVKRRKNPQQKENDITACTSICMGLSVGSGEGAHGRGINIFKWEWEENGKPCSAEMKCNESVAQLLHEKQIWCGTHDEFSAYDNDEIIAGKPYLTFTNDKIGKSDAREFEFNCGDQIRISKDNDGDDGDIKIVTKREEDSPDNSGNIDMTITEVKVGGNGKVKKITTKTQDKKTGYVKDQSEEKF